jgi:multiple sugar transport system substrate-binding protein
VDKKLAEQVASGDLSCEKGGACGKIIAQGAIA